MSGCAPLHQVLEALAVWAVPCCFTMAMGLCWSMLVGPHICFAWLGTLGVLTVLVAHCLV